MSRSMTLLLCLCWNCQLHLENVRGAEDTGIDFNRDIRPLLANHCIECHGPDEDRREAGLRLDRRADATSDLGSGPAVVPGNSSESELIHRISSSDEDLRMPPPSEGNQLAPAEVALLAKWIEQGAPYDDHWSFQPIRRPKLPRIDGQPAQRWVRNPIDAFILRRLANRGIEPSLPAERTTLIRRVSLDLLGLPPTLEQVQEFVADCQPNAFERMLDRTLASPRFGERWGRHWLDQARYADSHGYTNDNERSMWPYRDWVIAAFNRDLPFDQFTVEQLAGDLLAEPKLAQQVATGFHRNTLINSEGGTKADQFRDEQVKDRVDTTGLVWMGLTVGCAKCHAHKFDPLSQDEYYALYAFFNSTADSNSVTPVVKVPSPHQLHQLEQLRRQRLELQQQIDTDLKRRERQASWEAAMLRFSDDEVESVDQVPWTTLELSGKSDQESTFETLPDKSLRVQGEGGPKEEYQATAQSPLTTIRSVRLEVLTDPLLPSMGPGRADDGNFVLSEFWFRTGDGRELRFSKAVAEHAHADYEVSQSLDGKADTGWAIGGAKAGGLNQSRTAWFVLPEPLKVEKDHALIFKMQFHTRPHHGLGRYRLSISGEEWIDRPTPQAIARLLAVPKSQRGVEAQARIDNAFAQTDQQLREIQARLDDIAKRIETIEREIPSTMVLRELERPRQAYIQVRGDFLRRGDDVFPDVPSILPPLGPFENPDRLEFANWLTANDHPLTARVRVNRVWMRLFGRGLVETENDFGVQGAMPSHPELLDWLSSEFIRQEWSTKKLLRTIMTSSTYRQRSHFRPELDAVDPSNHLLARQSRLRVEAEIVRDLALAVSGILSSRIGGASVFPPQPAGVYAFTQRKLRWLTSQGEDRYRRGMYTFFYRTAPYPMLSTFDTPKFNTACTSRDRSNTPLQSLTMANSAVLFELAERLGQRLITEMPDASDGQRIEYGYRLCFSRAPTTTEVDVLRQHADKCRQTFTDERQVWTEVARVLMNLDEFVTRE